MKKGFTLLELLAVIIILAVIAIIATPVVLNVVDEAKKGAFLSSANGVIDAIRYKNIELQFAGNEIDNEYTFPNNDIKLHGMQPTGGFAKVDKAGNIQIAIYDGKYCAIKDFVDEQVTITDYVEGKCVVGVIAELQPGLYETGTTTLLTSWDDLINNEIVHVENGVVYTNVDISGFTNSSAEFLNGDLVLPNDGSITKLGDFNSSDGTGKVSFALCQNLTGIVIPASVQSIGDFSFALTGVTSVIFKENSELRTIDQDTFYLGNIQEIIFEDNSHLLTIDKNSFNNTTTLQIIDFGENSQLMTIGESAFSGTSLTNIIIPSNVTEIGDYAFSECANLTNVILPNELTEISSGLFSDCVNLTSVEIPSSVTTIGNGAFFSSGLKSIIIPNSVTSIGRGAFGAGSSGQLERVIFEENSQLPIIEEEMFRNQLKLKEISIPDSVLIIGKAAFMNNNIGTGMSSSLETILFGENSQLTTIGDSAFTNCDSLKNIIIPATVTSIGDSAFSGCHSLVSITIPDGVTVIEDQTFYMCNELTEIVIPSSVTSIGEWAFARCSKLDKITIPAGVARIGAYAFTECSLSTASFEDVNTWFITESSDYTGGTEVDLSDEDWNGAMLRSRYREMYWYKQ